MKNILSLVSTLIVCVIFGVSVQAIDSDIAHEQFGTVIAEEIYVDEVGNTITDTIYFKPDNNIEPRANSGSGTYRNEKSVKWSSGKTTIAYAQGYFVWGNGNVSVSNRTGGFSGVPSDISVYSTNLSQGTGGFVVPNAYVRYELVLKNSLGVTTRLTPKITVNANGAVG